MTKTPILSGVLSVAPIGCWFSFVLLSLALSLRDSLGSETTINSGHVGSDCPACDRTPARPAVAAESVCIDHAHRTGHPETQSRFARPSLNQHYSFGYVGGGAAFWGEPRFPDEGTWGVDYSGILFNKRIWLPWLHGNREPRHVGSYQTDGPRLFER